HGRRDTPTDVLDAGGDVVAHALVAEVLGERTRIHKIRRRETFGEETQRRGKRDEGVVPPPLPVPEPGETHGGAQFPRPAALAASRPESTVEALLGGDFVLRFGEVQ